MNCEQMLELISGHIDGWNTPEEENKLQEHLSQCAHCREALSQYEQMDRILQETAEPAPEGLCADIMTQIRKETKRTARRRWSSLAVAAVLVIVVGTAAAVVPDFGENGVLLDTDTPETLMMARQMPVAEETEEPCVEMAAEEAMPESALDTASAPKTKADPHTLAETLAQDRNACVIVISQLYPEVESLPCETLEEGYLLYILPDHNAAVLLSETYGCVIYEPDADTTVAYALLVP